MCNYVISDYSITVHINVNELRVLFNSKNVNNFQFLITSHERILFNSKIVIIK